MMSFYMGSITGDELGRRLDHAKVQLTAADMIDSHTRRQRETAYWRPSGRIPSWRCRCWRGWRRGCGT